MNGSRFVRGQSVVVVALCAVVLIALVALAIDGGSALFQRRNMQNGADAAVLGVIDLMQQNTAVTCNPAPCHPAYLVTNQGVLDRVDQLVTANRGGTVGTATYSTLTEYHIMAGAPNNANTYQPASAYPGNGLLPDYTDGVRVTAQIGNPTTFARAININTIPVSAAAAARLYPSCPVTEAVGDSLPMVRFRPEAEDFMRTNGSNDPCHLFEFWDSQGDFGLKNLASFNVYSLHQQGATQTLSGFDMRNGPSGGLVNFGSGGTCPTDCADMRGSTQPGSNLAVQDVENWIFYKWLGQISLTSTRPASTGTRGPADRTNGAQGSTARPGDWIETYTSGNWGNGVSDPLYASALLGTSVPYFSPDPPNGLGWGPGLDRTVFLWGPESIPVGGSTRDYAQEWESRVTIPNQYCHVGPCVYTGWEDLLLKHTQGNNGGYDVTSLGIGPGGGGSVSVDRVRLTRAIKVRFYANLQGNHGSAIAPPGCSLPSPRNSSQAWGLIMSQVVPGPPPGGGCNWQVGGGVYSRIIDP
jgi:Flp pilus assembly protein TadG